MALRFALAGNPNSGKTTLFNQLTGSTAKVGNWPGVTVERKEGKYKKSGLEIQIIDLPGIYSLSPYSPEEVIARNYMINETPDLVINIVDATNLERNLYLTTQIMETDAPVVVALNMMDMVKKQNDSIDVKALEKELGLPVVPISASTNQGIAELMKRAEEVAGKRREPRTVLEGSPMGVAAETIREKLAGAGTGNSLYFAVKLLESDEDAGRSVNLPGDLQTEINEICQEARKASEMGDLEAESADLRYKYITAKCSPLMERSERKDKMSVSDKIDRVLTNRVLGLPIFAAIMFLIFHLTFTENLFFVTGLPGPGTLLAGWVETGVEIATDWTLGFLESAGASDWAIGLVIDGIFAGVGAVLGFLPLVLVLYFFISLLESSGYMARAAFIMDRLLRRFGLSGKSFVPMLMGFGCSVPAITATRTLENARDRFLTIMLIPFMSCGAKIPIYALIVPIFFPNYTDLVVFGFYALGIIIAILVGLILKNTVFKGDASPFIMELPAYRAPTVKSMAIHLWEKLKGFAIKVGTIITVATIVIWFLANFGFDGGFGMVEANSDISILGYLGRALQWIFWPLGFVDTNGWKAVVAILAGLVAKEAVVGTMGQLYAGMPDDVSGLDAAPDEFNHSIADSFTTPGALAFIAFNVFSIPCMAAVGAIAGEMNSRKRFWFTLGMLLVVAWVVSFVIYWVSRLIMAVMGIPL